MPFLTGSENFDIKLICASTHNFLLPVCIFKYIIYLKAEVFMAMKIAYNEAGLGNRLCE
jgi:hypothetical protein